MCSPFTAHLRAGGRRGRVRRLPLYGNMSTMGFRRMGSSLAMNSVVIRKCSHRPPIISVCWAIGGRTVPYCCRRQKSHTHCESRLEVLGWVLDKKLLTVTMTQRVLQGWPASRLLATARQVLELTIVFHACVIRSTTGRFFCGKMLAAIGIPQVAVFLSSVCTPGRCVALGPMFHDDLEVWRWIMARGMAARGRGRLSRSCVMSSLPPRPFNYFWTLLKKRSVGETS